MVFFFALFIPGLSPVQGLRKKDHLHIYSLWLQLQPPAAVLLVLHSSLHLIRAARASLAARVIHSSFIPMSCETLQFSRISLHHRATNWLIFGQQVESVQLDAVVLILVLVSS
jgi:hypothetical protein